MTRGSVEPVCSFSPVTTSTVQVPRHLTCLPRLFSKTLGDWAFSRVKWIWPFPNTPQLQATQGVWAHTLASKLLQSPCDRPAGWLSPTQEGCACCCSSVLRPVLGNVCSLPQCVTQRAQQHSPHSPAPAGPNGCNILCWDFLKSCYFRSQWS